MDKQAIYNALNPDWWVIQTSNFGTQFISTEINFTNESGNTFSYVSSAPYQTNGLNAGSGPFSGDLSGLIDQLRVEASQRLYDQHCTSIIGNTNLSSVYGAES